MDLIHSDIPGYQNFVRIPPAFFNLIKDHIHHHIKKSVTKFRMPLDVWLKLAIMLRHLATGETYSSLQHNWLVHQTTICKFVPQVCRSIPYLCFPNSPDEWKWVEEKFRSRWHVPYTVGEIEGKHIAMKKPKKSDSDFYNYKDFFSLVLLTLVDTFSPS